jgi:flagellar export protein FliJ
LAADAQITAQRGMLAQERAALAEARKQTKVLERLQERQRQAYLVELNRRERAELDEMNSTRFAHALLARGDAVS